MEGHTNIREYGEYSSKSDFFLPPHTRFLKHPSLDIVQRRIIVEDKVYLLTVESSKWNKQMSNIVSKWIYKNKSKITVPFLWGKIEFLPKITPEMLIENRCENCNTKLSCYRHKVRHMSSNTCLDISTLIPAIDSSGNVISTPDATILTKESGNIINIREQNNNNIIIQNNIQIRDFGNENPAWLTSNLLHLVMNNVEKAIPHLMAKKHFNDEFPENKNLRLSNVRDINKRLQIYHGGRWAIRDSKQTFYQVLVDIYDILSDALSSDDDDDTIVDEIRSFRESERFIRKIGRIRPIWERFRQKIQSDDKEVMNDLWEDLKTMLLDRQLAIEQGFE
jgi:hypothetical protein